MERPSFPSPPVRLRRGAAAWTLLAAALPLLGGCAVPSRQSAAVPLPLPGAFSRSGDGALAERWWETLGDGVLDALVEQGLSGSFTLGAAWERLHQADATARRVEAPLRPTLDGTADASAAHRANTIEGARGGRTRSNDTSIGLGLAARYEVDLWGRIQSLADASTLDAQAAGDDVRTAAITLSWRITDTWVRLVEQYALEDLLAEQIATDDAILELIDVRFRTGRVPAEDVLRQRQLQEAKRESRASARRTSAVLERELAVLLGRSPTESVAPRRSTFPDLPPLPDTGAPSELLARRPDIRAALARIQAADARVAAAVADRYPSVRITAAASHEGPDVHDVFDNWLATIAAGLTAPLLDGGEREAEVERSEAVVRERVQLLGETVLGALEEVETALVREQHQREGLDSLLRQKALSDEIVQRTRDRYLGGAADYLRVLEALSTAQALDRRILAARRILVQDRVDLYRALAGGWTMERPMVPGRDDDGARDGDGDGNGDEGAEPDHEL